MKSNKYRLVNATVPITGLTHANNCAWPHRAVAAEQLMTGEPRPRYSALQLLGESGAYGPHQAHAVIWWPS